MEGHLLFLGTGSSLGIPVVGCKCSICTSTLAYNQRLRSSVLISLQNKKILIDAGPDFRQQALRYAIDRLDGLLLSHLHEDHVSGIDDMRSLYYAHSKTIPCLLSQTTFEELKIRFHYLFAATPPTPYFDFRLLPEEMGRINCCNFTIHYVTYYQDVRVTGYRIGDVAYITDIRHFSEEIFSLLRGVKTLVISVLRQPTTSLHLGLNEVIAFSKKALVEKTYFTHISHELEPEKTTLPENFFWAYDGLQLPFSYEV